MDHGVGRSSPVFVWLLILSLAFLVLIYVLPFSGSGDLPFTMVQASERMVSATQALRECRAGHGLAIDPDIDINRTGLIGGEFSPITTSVGQLEAKRTTTNPNAAGLIVLLLHQAGVRRGDTIAVGASGSFPALIIATLCAASVMDVDALFIPSLGASQWGANHPEFHWLIMQDCLEDLGLIRRPPVAVSLGGDNDVGTNMAPEGRALLERAMEASGLTIIREQDLKKNVAWRTRLLRAAANGAAIRAFVNIGGTFANIGTDSLILEVKPGVARIRDFPPPERQGMVFAMAARNVPVIHLLFIRGLATEYGLPWDPKALPSPGQGTLYRRVREQSLTFIILGLVYLAIVIALLLFHSLRFRRPYDAGNA
jgi:poly-gamma-glutamate system protein